MLNASMSTEMNYYNTEDGDGNTTTVPIPAGFAPTGIEGENTVREGLVITDENGNEFVWVPCTTTREGDTINYNELRDGEWKEKQYYYNGGKWGDSQPTKIGNPSIKTNKGFYVARYEAGIPSDAPFYPSDNNNYKYYNNETFPTKNTDQYTAVSKKGEPAWNYINQTQAKTVAEKMVNNGSVKSYLIDSHAWDTICRVIQKYDSTKTITDSTKWGNYHNNDSTNYESLDTLYALHQYIGEWKPTNNYTKGKVQGRPNSEQYLELSTGASEDFKAYNIYDLAGNLWEWTTENGIRPNNDYPSEEIPVISTEDVIDAEHAVFRGGGWNDDGRNSPIVRSYGEFAPSYCDHGIGFRVVLYLK